MDSVATLGPHDNLFVYNLGMMLWQKSLGEDHLPLVHAMQSVAV